MGRILIEKGEFFGHLINFTLVISLYVPKQNEFDLQKQTKWWQRMIQICQILSKKNLVFICIDVALLLLLCDVLA
jgi:hypothetical protein